MPTYLAVFSVELKDGTSGFTNVDVTSDLDYLSFEEVKKIQKHCEENLPCELAVLINFIKLRDK